VVPNQTFRTIAYHTLFFVDFYLSQSEDDFELRDFPSLLWLTETLQP
jgi:hypothetical protein